MDSGKSGLYKHLAVSHLQDPSCQGRGLYSGGLTPDTVMEGGLLDNGYNSQYPCIYIKVETMNPDIRNLDLQQKVGR